MAALVHSIPLTDTDPLLSAPQVSISKLSFPFKLKASEHRKTSTLAAERSVLNKIRGSTVVARAHLPVQSSSETIGESNFSKKSECSKEPVKGLKGLRSNGLMPRQLYGVQDLQDNSKKAVERLRGLSALQTNIQSNKPFGNLEQGKARRHLFLDPPADNAHPGGLEAALIDRDHSSTPKKPPKRRGSRNSSRGFDVLDDLMLSQGRSSRAVLESLQSEVAIEADEIANYETDSVDDARKSSFLSRKSPARNGMAGLSQMIADSRKVQRWQPTYEDKLDSASMPSPFASSIERALSPSAKSFGSTNASTSIASVVQQSVQPSELEDISNRRQPGLRGQEVLWALQKAAIEKAKQKQKSRKPNDRAVRGKETAVMLETSDWQNAKPIVLKSEWVIQIDDIERRIETLKSSVFLS